jgi:hypothetical protein
LLIDHLRLKEQLDAREKLIKEKSMFPVFHYDKRVQTLRKALGFWFKKAEEDCGRMKNRVREVKTRLEEEKNALREEMRTELAKNQQ